MISLIRFKLATQNSKNDAVRTVPILAALTKYDLLTQEQILAVDENMFQVLNLCQLFIMIHEET